MRLIDCYELLKNLPVYPDGGMRSLKDESLMLRVRQTVMEAFMVDKVYVITKGYYSDYHICAVTAEKKRAEELKKMYTDDYDAAKIEEYKLNECVERFLYGVVFDSNGNFVKIKADDYNILDKETEDDWSEEGLTCWVFAKDADHAKKKAQDKRAEYLARQEHID